MHAGGTEPERLEALLRDFGRADLGKPQGPDASRAKLREQLRQTDSTIFDERPERHYLRACFALHVKKVGLDSLIGGDGESCDLVLPCSERLDRALPANLRMILPEETIGGEIVGGDRNQESAILIVNP